MKIIIISFYTEDSACPLKTFFSNPRDGISTLGCKDAIFLTEHPQSQLELKGIQVNVSPATSSDPRGVGRGSSVGRERDSW